MTEIYQSGLARNIDPLLLRAIAMAESNERDDATSRVGAAGRMQFMPRTAAEYGVRDPRDPKQAVPGAAAKLDDLLKQHGDLNKALMAWNGGNPSRWNNPETQAFPGRVARAYAQLAQAPAPAQNDPFSRSLTRSFDSKPEAATDDPFSRSLTAPNEPQKIDAPQTSMSGFGNSVLRGIHQATDVPAVALARGADYVAGKLGFDTNFAQDATNAPKAFNEAYDADPNNRGFVPGAARFAGNALVTIPAAMGGGRLVDGAGAVAGLVSPAARLATPVASGAAQGAAVAGMTGEPVGEGALVGGVLGGALGAVGAGVNKLTRSSDPMVARAVNDYGIPLRAGQTSDSAFVRKLDQMVGQLPGSGMAAANAEQRAAFNRAVARTFGENVDEITPEVMQNARRRIGAVMNNIESNHTVRLDPQFRQELTSVVTKYGQTLTQPELDVVGRQITGVLRNVQPGRQISGETYGNLIGHNSPLMTAASNPNPNIAKPAQEIAEALRNAMQRSLPEDVKKAYSEARYQYKNMMTITGLVNRGAPGDISPLMLQSAANRSFKQNAFRGAGDLGELGDVGQKFMRAPQDSGTPLGMVINQGLYGDVKTLAKTALGATAGRGVGSILRANPTQDIAGIPGGLPALLLLRNRLLAPELSAEPR